ncbi:MAG: hypothetical protein Q4C56_07585 [Peptococcaceae bacterium]|nr:hypothetical protein [Peptococcaceae bacterium]
MRILMFILSLACSAAFVVLNVFGYQGVLTNLEFIAISAVAEIVLCFVLGHFMYRTYANYRRAKKLTQEMTSLQATLHVQSTAAAAEAPAAPSQTQPEKNSFRKKQAPVQDTGVTFSSEDFKRQLANQQAAAQSTPNDADDSDLTHVFQKPLN